MILITLWLEIPSGLSEIPSVQLCPLMDLSVTPQNPLSPSTFLWTFSAATCCNWKLAIVWRFFFYFWFLTRKVILLSQPCTTVPGVEIDDLPALSLLGHFSSPFSPCLPSADFLFNSTCQNHLKTKSLLLLIHWNWIPALVSYYFFYYVLLFWFMIMKVLILKKFSSHLHDPQ